jgi:arylsulfatase
MIIKSPSFDPSLQGGAVVPAFATVMDILPTVLDLIGVEHPVSVGQDRGTYRGRAVERVRGVSWVPYFVDRSTATIHGDGHAGTPHGWELFGRAGLRRGNDKIVHLGYGGRTDAKDWQLFDLAVDPGETRDLAAEKPELLRELLGLWDAYVRETGVAWGAEAMPHGDVDASAFDKSTWVGGDALEHQKAWMKTRKGERPS